MKQCIKGFLVPLVLLLIVASCSKMDDYLQYTEGKEITYTGKVDSVLVRSGKRRVVITGLLTSDPNITLVKIYYNQHRDSILIDIKRSAGVDTLNVPIPLPEGSHNFELVSFDNKGHTSVKVLVTGRSYGAIYQETLFNRAVKNAEKIGDDAVIDLYNGDETSPFTKFTYITNADVEKTVQVTNDSAQVVLKDFKSMSTVMMQTFFLPDSSAVDTFWADPEPVVIAEDVTGFYIKNAGNPFLRSDNGTGKWGIPKDWEYTPNVLNQNGSTAGGWSTDGNPSGVIHFESKDWGGEGVENGKIFQHFNLAPGTYELSYYSDGAGGTIDANLVAAKGDIIPDIGQLNDSEIVLGYFHGTQNNVTGNHSFTFRITEETPVAVGWVVKIESTTWLHFNWIKLRLLGK